MRTTSPLTRTLFIAFCLFATLGALALFSGRAFWSKAHHVLGSAPASFAPLVIDSFTTSQAAVSDPPGSASNVSTGGADILGQRRGLQVNLQAGAGPVSASVSGGTLSFTVTATTPNSRGEAVVTWDGDSDPNVLSPTGLGGVDLTAMNNSAFRIRVNAAGAGTELVLTVYTNASNASQAALRLPVVAASTDFFLSYPTDFIASLGSGANFANVGAIVLTVRGTATSAVIDSIEAVPPGLTFTKQDLTLADLSIGGTPQAPGTKIKYRMTIANTGGAATGLQLADMIDANTTLDAASLDTAPVLRNDAYATAGNVNQTVAVGAGLLANDLDADMNGALPALVVTTTGAVATTLGGTATLNADGSFSYDPPVGVGNAVDTFPYSASDNEGNSNSAMVTINIGPVIWFVADAHPGLNLGTRDDPFVGFNAANVAGAGGLGDQDRPGDTIFLYAGSHVSGLELEAGQQLIGEGQGLVLNGQTLVPAGTAPTITSAGNGIVLAQNNTIRGLTVGNTAGVDLTGSNFGTLTVSNVTLNGTGGALDLTNGALAATFNSISSTNSVGRGINLELVTGSLAVPGGTSVTDSAQAGIRVTNNGSTYDFGATTLNSTTSGLELTDNATTTFNFASLAVTTDAGGVGLLATNSGTLNIGGTGNTITTTNALALNVSSTSFGAGATFSAINVTGTAGGINLTTTTGALTLSDVDINVSGATAVVASSATLNLDSTNANSATVTATGQRAFTLTSVTTTGFNLANTSSTGTINGIVASACTGTFNFGDTTVTSNGTGIDLSSSASGIFTFDDLDVTASAGIALAASSAGTVNVDTNDDDSPVLSATTRPVLDIDNTTIHLNLATLTSASSTTHGVDLTNILANSTLGVSGTTTVTSPTSIGVNLDDIEAGSSLVFGNFGVTNRGSHGIFIQDHDGTTVTFGDVDITNGLNAGGDGVHVQTSGGGATSTGSLTFASLDISSTNATVNRSDAGGDGIPDNETHDGHGVKLIDHTGGLIVTGDGTQGNGGTIQNIEGDGFCLIRSGGLNLDEMTINNIGTSNQAAASVDNAGIWAYNIVGSNTISNSTISRFQDGSVGGGSSCGVFITNNGTSFTNFRSTDTTYFNDNSLLGDDGIQLVTNNTVNGALIVESAFNLGNVNNNSEFFQISGTGVQVIQNGGGTLTTSISDTTFRDTITPGGFGGIDMASAGSGIMSNNIDECLFYDLYPGGVNNSGVITLFASKTVDYDATVNNCTFGATGERTSDGRGAIRASTDLDADDIVTDFDITITNNTIDDTDREAISLLPRGPAVPLASGRTMDFIVTGNDIGQTTAVSNDAGLGREGIEFVSTENAKTINLTLTNNTITNFVDSSSDETVDIKVNDNTSLNLVVRGNTFNQTGSAGTAESIDVSINSTGALCLDMNSANTSGNTCPHGITITETAGTFLIEDIGGAAIPAATVDTFIEARNTGSATVTGTFDSCNSNLALMPTGLPRDGLGQHQARPPDNFSANNLNSTPKPARWSDAALENRPKERAAIGFGNQASLLAAAYQAQSKVLALSKRWAGFQPWFSFSSPAEPAVSAPAQISQELAEPAKQGYNVGRFVAKLFGKLTETLAPTVQAHERLSTVAPSQAPLPGGTLNLSLGTLPTGQSVTVEFEVTINNPVTGGAMQIANQGTLSGSNFANVVSDDPDTVAPNDVTVTMLVVNLPPTISSHPVPVKAGSNAASFTIATALDPDQPVNTLGLTINGNPTTASSNGVTVSAVTLTPSGAVTANIATTCAATSATFALVVTDSQNTTGMGTLTVNVTSNLPPLLSYNAQTVTANSTPSFNPAAGPNDNGTVSSIVLQSVTPNNGGLAVNVNNMTGQVQVASATLSGVYTVVITATDNCGAMTNSNVTVNVSCPNITLTPTALPNGVQGTAYNQMVSATPAGTTYSYAVTTGTLPPGLTLNQATGAITGTPTAGGNYVFGVTATGWAAGSGGCPKTQSYNLLITGTCATITLTPTTLPPTNLGVAYNQTVSASPAGTYTFAVTQGALPPGLTLDTSTGAITGTATSGGSFSFRLSATGAGGCGGSRTYVLAVGCAAFTFAPPTLPGATKNVAYSQTITVTPAGAYTFSLLLGSLPPGFTLSSAGVLSGVANQTGTFNFTLKALGGTCQSTKAYTLVITANTAALAQLADYNGDGKGDFALWSSNGTWRLSLSPGSAEAGAVAANRQAQTQSWGMRGDLTLLGDYDGDGRTDLAVFRPANGTWYIKRSSDGSALNTAWGLATDVPVPGDYDGDGRTDVAVFRPSDGHWYVLRSSDRQYAVTAWGAGYAPYHDLAVPGDYDGDSKTDLAVFRRGTGQWLVRRSSDGQFNVKVWGLGTDVPVAADYDGDGKTDLAVWRASTWYIWQSATNNGRVMDWGLNAAPYFDQAAPNDYDGDGQADVAVWRSSDQTWYVRCSLDSSVMSQAHGQTSDRPVAVAREP